jgi:hypothetical protein
MSAGEFQDVRARVSGSRRLSPQAATRPPHRNQDGIPLRPRAEIFMPANQPHVDEQNQPTRPFLGSGTPVASAQGETRQAHQVTTGGGPSLQQTNSQAPFEQRTSQQPVEGHSRGRGGPWQDRGRQNRGQGGRGRGGQPYRPQQIRAPRPNEWIPCQGPPKRELRYGLQYKHLNQIWTPGLVISAIYHHPDFQVGT